MLGNAKPRLGVESSDIAELGLSVPWLGWYDRGYLPHFEQDSRRHWRSRSFFWFFEQEHGKIFRKNSDSPPLAFKNAFFY